MEFHQRRLQASRGIKSVDFDIVFEGEVYRGGKGFCVLQVMVKTIRTPGCRPPPDCPRSPGRSPVNLRRMPGHPSSGYGER